MPHLMRRSGKGGGASFGYEKRTVLVRAQGTRAASEQSVVESSVLTSDTLPLSSAFLRQPIRKAFGIEVSVPPSGTVVWCRRN